MKIFKKIKTVKTVFAVIGVSAVLGILGFAAAPCFMTDAEDVDLCAFAPDVYGGDDNANKNT